eukprot:sb/3471821/
MRDRVGRGLDNSYTVEALKKLDMYHIQYLVCNSTLYQQYLILLQQKPKICPDSLCLICQHRICSALVVELIMISPNLNLEIQAAVPRNLTVLSKNNMFSRSKVIYKPPPQGGVLFPKLVDALENLTSPYLAGIEEVDDMAPFILKTINETHGDFNKKYIMGFSTLEDLPNGQVSVKY